MDIFACLCDRELDIKQEEKVNKYLDLAVQIKGLWNMKSVKVVPLAKRLEDYLRNINAGTELEPHQNTVLLGSARILQRVLEISSIDKPAVKRKMILLFIYVTPIIYDLQYVITVFYHFRSAVSDSISMCIHSTWS